MNSNGSGVSCPEHIFVMNWSSKLHNRKIRVWAVFNFNQNLLSFLFDLPPLQQNHDYTKHSTFQEA